jgi:polysaccharide deacetylase family protein (PEP-CTERM system associated)
MSNQLNFLTVDLEEWYVAEALADQLPMADWDRYPSTVQRNTRRLLDLFDRAQVRATFFILGWCAERHPELIREIDRAGHELACHGYRHGRISEMTPEEFRQDTERAIEAIGSAVGFRPRGYRAPSWSVTPQVSWAFETLVDLGFDYDSSIFPIKHDLYGIPEGPRDLFKMTFPGGKQLWEFPASTHRLMGRNIPVGGGGHLRHSPYWYSRRLIRRLNRDGRPVVVYVHPWEFDPDPPRIENLTLLQRFRTYGSTGTFIDKLARVLDDFEFVPMWEYLVSLGKRRIGFERP